MRTFHNKKDFLLFEAMLQMNLMWIVRSNRLSKNSIQLIVLLRVLCVLNELTVNINLGSSYRVRFIWNKNLASVEKLENNDSVVFILLCKCCSFFSCLLLVVRDNRLDYFIQIALLFNMWIKRKVKTMVSLSIFLQLLELIIAHPFTMLQNILFTAFSWSLCKMKNNCMKCIKMHFLLERNNFYC